MARKVAMLVCAMLLALSMTVPALAAEQYYPFSVEEYTEGNVPRIKKTYQLSLSDDPALIPTEDFEREGHVYRLLNMTRRDEVGVDTKTHTETVTMDSSTGELSEILTMLDGQRNFTTKDGYSGVLLLDHTSIRVEVKGYQTSTRNLSATRTYPSLSDADLSLIPKSITDNGKNLTLADVQWSGDGQTYTATASYTGTSSSRSATGYTVTASYTGELSKPNCQVVTYTAVFSGMDVMAEGEEAAETPGATLPLPVYMAVSAAIAVAAVLLIQNRKSLKKSLLTHSLAIALIAVCLCGVPANALEYTISAPSAGEFGTPTSDDDTIREWENPNTDKSKNSALIPPGFGTPTSYLPGSGEYLTPNLVPGALSGGLMNQVGSAGTNTTGGVAGSSTITGEYPSVDTSGNFTMTQIPNSPTGIAQNHTTGGYTEVTGDLYYANGSLGTLKIPAIGLSVKVVQGTDSAALAKGVGHFVDTSIWDGNVCLAGHNRGTNNYFGKIHTLEAGDTITLATMLVTRTYAVASVEKVGVTDTSGTAATTDNHLTLYTCVMNQPDYRWCVTALQV